MMKKIKNFLERGIPRNFCACRSMSISYSQLGEDLSIVRILKQKGIRKGYYIDIGAFHPVRYSNTYRLYLTGYSGIVVDPNTTFTDLWAKYRPRDKFVKCAISATGDSLFYHKSNYDQARNYLSADAEPDDSIFKEGEFTTSEIPTVLPDEIPGIKKVRNDLVLVDIDCEGMDFPILDSLLGSGIRPEIISFEAHNGPNEALKELLNYSGYRLDSIHLVTHIYSLG